MFPKIETSIQEGHALPKIDCIVEDGYMIVHVPADTPIFDSNELCHYPRCRKRTTLGIHMQQVQYCEEHVQYSRLMQRRTMQMDNEKGIPVSVFVTAAKIRERQINEDRDSVGAV